MMQHILQALDDQIGFLKQQHKFAQQDLSAAQSRIVTLEKENHSLRLRVQGLEASEQVLLGSITALKAQLAAVPPTLSRAEYDALADMREGVTDRPDNRRYDLEKVADGQV
jgi:chromosome segregation ATPase